MKIWNAIATDLFIFILILIFLVSHMAGMFKAEKENENKIIEKMTANNTKGYLEKVLADVSKQSATKQILIGATSGW